MTDQVAAAGPKRSGRYNPDDPALSGDLPRRHAALTQAAAGIKVRASKVPVEQILLVGAAILFPLGLVFIMLGWYGSAHTGRLYAQIDYLISGGLLGIGVSAAGGFLYFGYWLSRQLGESRRQNALTLQALRRLEDALTARSTNGSTSPWPGLTEPAPQPEERRGRNGTSRRRARADDPTGEVPLPMLVATARGSLLHLPDCPVVANRPGLKSVPAGTEGYGYCSMCDSAGAVSAQRLEG
jgi:hypothetical protein